MSEDEVGLISDHEVAALIGISTQTVNMRAGDLIPAHRFGRVWRFRKATIAGMMSGALPASSKHTRLVRMERVRIGLESVLIQSADDWEDVLEPTAVLEIRRDVINIGTEIQPEAVYGMTTGWLTFPHTTHRDRAGQYTFSCSGVSGRCAPVAFGGQWHPMFPPEKTSRWQFIGPLIGLDLDAYFGTQPSPTDEDELTAGPKIKRPRTGHLQMGSALRRRDFAFTGTFSTPQASDNRESHVPNAEASIPLLNGSEVIKNVEAFAHSLKRLQARVEKFDIARWKDEQPLMEDSIAELTGRFRIMRRVANALLRSERQKKKRRLRKAAVS